MHMVSSLALAALIATLAPIGDGARAQTAEVVNFGRAVETVFDADPGTIAVPALVVSNSGDGCIVSPPGDAPRLLITLTRSPRKELVLVESSQIQSEPCEALSPHGYLGIEAMVVQRIADWIKAAPGR